MRVWNDYRRRKRVILLPEHGPDHSFHLERSQPVCLPFLFSFHQANGVTCPGTDGSFRLPFGWQYMVGNNQASTSLDATFLSQYDTLVQGVLKSGGYAMLDLHNYARWNGGIVGQGGPSDANVS
jgi:hypothetical protein